MKQKKSSFLSSAHSLGRGPSRGGGRGTRGADHFLCVSGDFSKQYPATDKMFIAMRAVFDGDSIPVGEDHPWELLQYGEKNRLKLASVEAPAISQT